MTEYYLDMSGIGKLTPSDAEMPSNSSLLSKTVLETVPNRCTLLIHRSLSIQSLIIAVLDSWSGNTIFSQNIYFSLFV
jgi:hypothetical protein